MQLQSLLGKAINIYRYGSYVYGTYQDGQSDEDFIVIVPDTILQAETQLEDGNKQYTFYPRSQWLHMLENNEVCAVECAFLPKEFIIKQSERFPFELNHNKIREQFSATASNSWVKCKKKLTVEKDFSPRIAKKSLWHSLRILMFGIQLLSVGTIQDYSCANLYYNDIVNAKTNDWNDFHARYKSFYNQLKSTFRAFDRY